MMPRISPHFVLTNLVSQEMRGRMSNMAVLKCKVCGETLDIKSGESVCECSCCGVRQTVPVSCGEKAYSSFNRANRLRNSGDFDKASDVFKSIADEYEEEPETYWGLLLCRYGVIYEEEDGEKVLTCHRGSLESVLDDSDFELVREYSDPTSRSLYREEAKEIERAREEIIRIASEEKPYDIFISVKVTDDNQCRTADGVMADEIYDALTKKGYRVFCSPDAGEPYVFAALNSAKVMLAFGTDYEYYNDPRVKNEWSRFLKLTQDGEGKILIPCYKGLDAYDIPKEFSKCEAQDMAEDGAVDELVARIDEATGGAQTLPSDESAVPSGAPSEQLDEEAEESLEGMTYAELSDELKRVTDELNKLSKASYDVVVPSMIKKEEMQKEVEQLEAKRHKIGMFRKEERKAVTDEIDKVKKKMPTESQIILEKQELLAKDYQPRISRLNKRRFDIMEKMSKLR